VVVGAGLGIGIDYLIHGFPVVTIIGVFAGFALALYAVYLETR
jgi:F0F1-type ATP synthase assembly protein I